MGHSLRGMGKRFLLVASGASTRTWWIWMLRRENIPNRRNDSSQERLIGTQNNEKPLKGEMFLNQWVQTERWLERRLHVAQKSAMECGLPCGKMGWRVWAHEGDHLSKQRGLN